MSPLASDCIEFVFLNFSRGEHGALVSRPYYELLLQFKKATETCVTWVEFQTSFGPNAWEFIATFVGAFDGECVPDAGALLDELKESMWIFYDGDFPLLQCHQETYQFYRDVFPNVDGLCVETTEYGEPVAFYPDESYEEIRNHLESLGHRVTMVDYQV